MRGTDSTRIFFGSAASGSRFESRPRSRRFEVPPVCSFTNGGTARAGRRYVPDLEIQLDVTPRNLNLAP